MKNLLNIFIIVLLLSSCVRKEEQRVPVIGKKFLADFGVFEVKLQYLNDTVLDFAIVSGRDSGHAETVRVSRTEVRPNVYLVSWQEKSKTTVVHLEDYTLNKVYSKSTSPALQLYSYEGTLKPIE